MENLICYVEECKFNHAKACSAREITVVTNAPNMKQPAPAILHAKNLNPETNTHLGMYPSPFNAKPPTVWQLPVVFYRLILIFHYPNVVDQKFCALTTGLRCYSTEIR